MIARAPVPIGLSLSFALLLAGCASDDERMGHTVCAEEPTLPDCPGASSSGDDQPTLEASTGPDIATDTSDIDCSSTADAKHPDVVAAEISDVGDGTLTLSATLCSAYDTPERYADAWRVTTLDGEVLAVRELTHDHAAEQPFTRSLAGSFTLPSGVTEVRVEGRDLTNGWGGAALTIEVGETTVD